MVGRRISRGGGGRTSGEGEEGVPVALLQPALLRGEHFLGAWSCGGRERETSETDAAVAGRGQASRSGACSDAGLEAGDEPWHRNSRTLLVSAND